MYKLPILSNKLCILKCPKHPLKTLYSKVPKTFIEDCIKEFSFDANWMEIHSTLHKNCSFPIRISSVNVTKSAVLADLLTFIEEILNWKLHFLCSVKMFIQDLSKHLWWKDLRKQLTAFRRYLISPKVGS